MRKSLFLSFIIMVLFAYEACNNNNGTGPVLSSSSLSSPYFPLAIGNWWEYHGYTLDSNGNEAPGSEGYEFDTIVRTVNIQGFLAYVMNSSKSSQPVYLTFDSAGDLMVLDDTSDGAGKGTWYIAELFSNQTAGATVPYEISNHITGGLNNVYFDTFFGNVSVTVPAGTFTAVAYRDTNGYTIASPDNSETYSSVEHTYFAEKVGLLEATGFSVDAFKTSNSSSSIRQG